MIRELDYERSTAPLVSAKPRPPIIIARPQVAVRPRVNPWIIVLCIVAIGLYAFDYPLLALLALGVIGIPLTFYTPDPNATDRVYMARIGPIVWRLRGNAQYDHYFDKHRWAHLTTEQQAAELAKWLIERGA